MSHQVRRYHTVLVVLHWLMAVLVTLALILGSTVLDATPNSDPGKVDALRGHMIVGVVIGVLLVLRWITRRVTTHPPAATTGMVWADRLAPLAHGALYGGLLLMVASGVAMAVVFGLPEVVFNGQGALPPDFHASAARSVHGIVAKLLLITVLAHVAAACYHQWVRKDSLLSRMGFGQRRETQ
jgi:cytochrome b561